MGVRRSCPECGFCQSGPSSLRTADARRFCRNCYSIGRLVEMLPRVKRRRIPRSSYGFEPSEGCEWSDFVVCGVDLARELALYWRLPCIVDRIGDAKPPDLIVRSSDETHGFAHLHGTLPSIELNIGSDADAASVRVLLLHEVVHHCCPILVSHGRPFRALLATAASEAYGLRVVESDWRRGSGYFLRAYRLDDAIAKMLRERDAADG